MRKIVLARRKTFFLLKLFVGTYPPFPAPCLDLAFSSESLKQLFLSLHHEVDRQDFPQCKDSVGYAEICKRWRLPQVESKSGNSINPTGQEDSNVQRAQSAAL